MSIHDHASLGDLPLLRNPHDARGLAMTGTDIAFAEDMFAKIAAEYSRPGEWQHRMLIAYLSVLLTYLSRLYSEQHKATEISPERILLKNFQAKINESFQELHEVGDYAAMLHISAGHLSEVVKMQSGKPAIKHIHERLTLEARRLLFHTNHSLKEIAFDLGFLIRRISTAFSNAKPARHRRTIMQAINCDAGINRAFSTFGFPGYTSF